MASTAEFPVEQDDAEEEGSDRLLLKYLPIVLIQFSYAGCDKETIISVNVNNL